MQTIKTLLPVLLCIFLCYAHGVNGTMRPGPAALIDALTGSDPAKRDISLDYIKKTTPVDLLPKLVDFILKSRDEKDRNAAFETMKLYPSRQSAPYWTELLKKSDCFVTKKAIINHIAQFNDRRVSLPIAQELKSPYLTVREEAAKALKHADDRVYPYVLSMAESENPVLRIYAIEAFFHMYDRRFYGVVMTFLDDPNKSVRIYALRCIATNKLHNALNKIRALALNDENDEVRIEAIRTIGTFADKKSLYVLYNTLDDRNRNIRYETVKNIALIPYRKSAYPLSKRLKKENDHEIKKSIIDVLISFRHAGRMSGLGHVLLNDESADLRIEAAGAMGWIRNHRAIRYLVQALVDKDYRVRAESCASLGVFKTRKVMEDLMNIVTQDKVRYVRSASLYAIKKINDRKSILPLYDQYAIEKDPIFKEQLRGVIRSLLQRYL